MADGTQSLNEAPPAILLIRCRVVNMVEHIGIMQAVSCAELGQLLVCDVVQLTRWTHPRARWHDEECVRDFEVARFCAPRDFEVARST